MPRCVWPLIVCFALVHSVTSSQGQQYILSPASRTILPRSIYQSTGNVSAPTKDTTGLVTLTGPNASVTYDFGQMVAGAPEFEFNKTYCSNCNTFGLPGFQCGRFCSGIGLAFTESAQFVGLASDDSTLYGHPDGTLFLPVTTGRYTTPSKWQRGSFRYLTLSMPTSAEAGQTVAIQLNHIVFTAQPSMSDPSRYSGYFNSSDDLLNRIWYAGAYTNQLSTVAANSSVQHLLVLSPVGWEESAQANALSASDEYLSDGAKRDRNPWAADLSVGIRSSVVWQANLTSVRNSLKACFALQDLLSGYFPYAGSPLGNLFSLIGIGYDSDTYHLWTIIGFAEYVLASGDIAFGQQYWHQITRGVSATGQYVDTVSGLFSGTRSTDWGRFGQGGQNTALNALYYYALTITARVGTALSPNSSEIAQWTAKAASVKRSVNAQLYDSKTGLFFDNTTKAGHQLYPQDGNVLAVLFNVTNSSVQTANVLRGLAERHTKYGALAPELPGGISPFISGLELYARLQAEPNDSSAAISLLRTQWGYMLSAFSNSTLIEGYASDGSLNYPFYPHGSSFISHTHVWSTGPMYVLSARIAGLRASGFDVAATDGQWVFQPSVLGSGVRDVQAGFERPSGKYSVSWALRTGVFKASFSVPASSTGTVYLPTLGHDGDAQLFLDGKAVKTPPVDGFVRVGDISGGEHSMLVTF